MNSIAGNVMGELWEFFFGSIENKLTYWGVSG